MGEAWVTSGPVYADRGGRREESQGARRLESRRRVSGMGVYSLIVEKATSPRR